MKEKLHWIFVLGICSLILAVLMEGPQWLHQRNPLAQGIAISLNSDEAIYLARVEESLSGRPELSAEAFTGHPNVVGTQFAMLERWYGTLFRGTGWRASQVLTFLDALIPVLIFLSLVLFFQLLGFSKRVALFAATVFCLLQLYNLNRPIHMRSSFLFMLWALNFLLLSLRNYWWLAGVAGVLLGMLVGVYVWSFAFAWAFWGVYFVWETVERAVSYWHTKDAKRSLHENLWLHAKKFFWSFRPRKPSWHLQKWHVLSLIGAVGVLAALPFVSKYVMLHSHPLFAYGSFRSGMHPGRAPESWVYSTLFFVAVASSVVAHVRSYQQLKPFRPAFVLLLAAFIYMNQQVVHGITFNFVSHGIFSLVIAAIGIVAVALVTRNMHLYLGALALGVYLLAIGYDGRFVLKQWRASEGAYSAQHLAGALPVLDEMPRGRILSDSGTQSFIAGYTHHDIVYSVYLKNVLMTHREIALRYCLSQIPVPPLHRTFRDEQHLIMPDAVSAFKGDTRIQEVALVESACREVDLDPAVALGTFEVSHIFWNKQEAPNWDMRRFGVNLVEIASGDDWVLYRIGQ